MLHVIGSTTENRRLSSKGVSSVSSADDNSESRSRLDDLAEVLSDLSNLLEEYSPAWYTEAHRRKTQTALHLRKRH